MANLKNKNENTYCLLGTQSIYDGHTAYWASRSPNELGQPPSYFLEPKGDAMLDQAMFSSLLFNLCLFDTTQLQKQAP